ncbi:MAG: glycosyltransferase [Thermodesulfobacteriota bacterium]|nr:glycosyltransferase [Thermodesulfobacteriota bacterium]
MNQTHPTVSIGLPVFNGELYLEEAILSILSQTFEDFELLISDNASNDSTQDICLHYANLDPRIRYYSNHQNIGAAHNFNRTFALSFGKYFKWAAHDDLLNKTFLSRCFDVLENNRDVVLCHSLVRIIDENGIVLKDHNDNLTHLDSPHPHRRFFSAMSFSLHCYDIFGLIRSDVLSKTPLIAPYFGSDRCLLVALSLEGKIYRIHDYLFLSREHSARSVRKPVPNVVQWFDPNLHPRIHMPIWRYFIEYFKSVGKVSLRFDERLSCYIQLVRWFKWFFPLLKSDLAIASRQLTKRGRTTMG